MSVEWKVATVGRRLVACVREIALVTAYVALSAVIALPAILGTGAAMFWLEGRLDLTGYAYSAYFLVATVVLLLVFSKVRTLVLGLSRLLLGPTREMAIN